MQTKKDYTKEFTQKAYAELENYRAQRAEVDRRIAENRRLWSMGEGGDGKKISTGYLFNTIASKHAEAMDAIPSPVVYSRTSAASENALRLAEVLPSILYSANFEECYSRLWWEKLVCGTGVLGVFWRSDSCEGKGDICLDVIPLERIYWDSSVTNIDESKFVFVIKPTRAESLAAEFPGYEMSTGGENVEVVDCYYKKDDKLHFCKMAEGRLLYSSEKDGRISCWYDHGKFPFIIDGLYPDTVGLCGFGAVDVAKESQSAISSLGEAVMHNARVASAPRYFVREDSGINEEEFCDLESDIVHVGSSTIDESAIRRVEFEPIDSVYTDFLQMKIDEIKEVTGNRDFTQGSTTGGVTSGAAISALQEAGTRLSRDRHGACYRALEKMCYLIVELVRQFYTKPREIPVYREGGVVHVLYHNAALGALMPDMTGRSQFDIKMIKRTTSPFKREAANDRVIEMWNAGFFEEQNRESALLALELMDFDGIEELKARMGRFAGENQQ